MKGQEADMDRVAGILMIVAVGAVLIYAGLGLPDGFVAEAIADNLRRKEAESHEMFSAMAKHMSGITTAIIKKKPYGYL
jgi:hypothetical protein